MQLLNVPINWLLSTSINSLLSLIEIFYYFLSLFWFSHNSFIQLTLRLCTSLVMLSLPEFNKGIQKVPIKINTKNDRVYLSDLIIILMNSTLIFWEFSFIENTEWRYLAQEDRETMIFDIILESLWRFFILEHISASLVSKLLQAILSIRLASVIIQGDWHLAIRLKFLVGGILIGLTIFGIQRLKDIQSFRTLGAETENRRENSLDGNHTRKSRQYSQTMIRTRSEGLKSVESLKDNSFMSEDSRSNHISHLNIISPAKVLNFLPEGVTVLDIGGQVLFMNQYMANLFEFMDKFDLQDLSQSLCDFKFCEASVHANLSAKSEDSISSLRLEDRRLSHGSIGQSTQAELLERVLKITSLESFIFSCRADFKIRELAEKYMSTFQARYYQRSTNRWYTIEMKIHLESRNEKYFVILLRDITDRDNKLIALEKEKTLYRDNLIASFSHELRTPLNSNLAFLEQSMDCPTIPHEVKRDLIKPALDSGKLLLSMVDNILDYSLIILNKLRVDIKPYDIVQTVTRCMELFETKAVQKKLELSLILEGEIPPLVYSDHRRISQILINLLSNAMQFTTQGEIQVKISELERQNIRITVKDTGIGMERITHERLIKTLSSEILKEKLSEASVGSGLGLFISNKLVKSLNYDENTGIKFRSSYDWGSEFYFDIENREQSKYVASPKGKMFSDFDEKCDLSLKFKEYSNCKTRNTFKAARMPVKEECQVTALVVDDEIFNIIVIENYCKSMGIATEKALNGKEALEKLTSYSKSNSNTIKLVFMDINMPMMDGYETTMAIFDMMKKGEIEDVIVIGVTAYVSKDMIEKGIECGMTEVLNKPVTKEGLMEVMRKYKFVN